MIALIVLFLVIQIAKGTSIFYGKGLCAVRDSCGQIEDVYEATELLYDENEVQYSGDAGEISQAECELACEQAEECFAYSHAPNNTMCYLHGPEGLANFTDIASCDIYFCDYIEEFNGQGSLIVNGSGYGDFDCYALVASPSAAPSAQPTTEASALGDPHITSVYGCEFDAFVDPEKEINSAVLMECENEKVTIHYRTSWGGRISHVSLLRNGKYDEFEWKFLKHGQNTKVCGNIINFHRYFLGIQFRLTELHNKEFTGLLADKRCLH